MFHLLSASKKRKRVVTNILRFRHSKHLTFRFENMTNIFYQSCYGNLKYFTKVEYLDLNWTESYPHSEFLESMQEILIKNNCHQLTSFRFSD